MVTVEAAEMSDTSELEDRLANCPDGISGSGNPLGDLCRDMLAALKERDAEIEWLKDALRDQGLDSYSGSEVPE